MTSIDLLIKQLEIVVYQFDLVNTLKGVKKERLEGSTRDLFDLITHPCQMMARKCLVIRDDPIESRKQTAINMIEKLNLIKQDIDKRLSKKTCLRKKYMNLYRVHGERATDMCGNTEWDFLGLVELEDNRPIFNMERPKTPGFHYIDESSEKYMTLTFRKTVVHSKERFQQFQHSKTRQLETLPIK